MTFQAHYASEKALESAVVARQQHGAVFYKINQIAPGVSMGGGPSIRPQDLLREAEQVASSTEQVA